MDAPMAEDDVIRRLEAEVVLLRADAMRLTHDRTALHFERLQLETDRSQGMDGELDALRSRLRTERARAERAETIIDQMKRSPSWRLTEPLRRVKSLLGPLVRIARALRG